MSLSIGQCVSIACMLEVAAPKVGNVNRSADFADLTLTDFLTAAVAIGPPLERANEQGVGAAVLAAARATRELVDSNVNLGILLLVAPLAAVPEEESLSEGVQQVLANLGRTDARDVYAAIRLMQPAGLGEAPEMDVNARDAPPSLIDAMSAAAAKDLVARQYVNDFAQVLDECLPTIVECRGNGHPLPLAIVHAHTTIMSRYPDSLIARKCGPAVAQQAARMAQQVIDSGEPDSKPYVDGLQELDFWLRSDNHRRNPGTSADIVSAALFAGLRSRAILPPFI